MQDKLKLKIEILSRDFDRSNFDCGIESLNKFLKLHALPNMKKKISVTMVVVSEDNRKKILGYYSVSMAQISFDRLSANLSKGIPKYYPVPAMRIGKLAVDCPSQGKGLGGVLLRNALMKALELSAKVGTCVVLVDAIDASAQQFYERYGFCPLMDAPLSLVMAVDTIAEAYLKGNR